MQEKSYFKYFQGKRFFITGGTGFFGKSILDCASNSGIDMELVILSRDPAKFRQNYKLNEKKNLKISFIEGDILNCTFPAGVFDYVIHAAAEADTCQEDAPGNENLILEGTKRILNFSARAKVQGMLFISSGAVYGAQPAETRCISENCNPEPTTFYGKGKLLAEQLCADSGLNVLLARCFSFVGPRMNFMSHFAIGNFIKNCLCNETISIHGDGTALRSYLYADDLVRWLFTMLLNGQKGRPYNVGSDRAVSIRELAETVRRLLGAENDIEVLGQTVPGAAPNRYIPSIERAKNELGLSIATELEEAILKTAALKRALI